MVEIYSYIQIIKYTKIKKGLWMKFAFSGRYKDYTLADLRKDAIAGLIVGIIAIPLGMAFAIASGVKPEYGIYTIIIAGILIAVFGGSKFQIGGPTGAFIPILFAIVMQYGYENLLLAGFLAGIILVLLGIFKMGALIKFIPRPVTIGFTTGIAVIIFSGQIASYLGLSGVKKHEEFILNMKEIGIHFNTINIFSVITASICLAIIIFTPKLLPKVPGALLGLVVSSVAATIFFPGQVATIGSTFGEIPNKLPSFQLPDLSIENIKMLIKPALVIAMLGGIESLLSAVVADGMARTKHDSNRELIGQGLANIVAPLFGGIPATGAIARTATNIKSGAVSPFSGVIHGLVVLLVLVALAPFASTIPLASLAPILMVVAWNMSERKEFWFILKTKTGDSAILLITFLLTVFTNLTTAVEVGLVLAVIFFVKRMSETLTVSNVIPDPVNIHSKVLPEVVLEDHNCPQISIYTIKGSLFFGAAQQFQKLISDSIVYHPKILILRMGSVPYMDTTGEANLAKIVQDFKHHDVEIIISGLQQQPKEVLQKTGLYMELGQDAFFKHTADALYYALHHVDKTNCLGCQRLACKECSELAYPLMEFEKAHRKKALVNM